MTEPMTGAEVLIGLRRVIPHEGNPCTKAAVWELVIAYEHLTVEKKILFCRELEQDLVLLKAAEEDA